MMLRAGKHVLVEKPLATSVAEALVMVEAAEQAGVKFMVDFHCPLASAVYGREELRRAGRAWAAGDGLRSAERYDLCSDGDAGLGRSVWT